MESVLPKHRRIVEQAVFATALLVLFLVLVYGVYTRLPVHQNANPPKSWGFAVDWKGWIRPAILTTMSGESPYESYLGILPPWTYVLLSPVALLEPAQGAAVNFVLTYFGYFFMLYRLRLKPVYTALFLLSPFVFQNALNGNIDWLAAVGFALPAPVGLFFVLIKPQIGFGIALYWLIGAWRSGGVKQVLRTFSPVTSAYLLSFAIYGFWPAQQLTHMPQDTYNASIFPLGLPIAAALIWLAVRKKKPTYAMAAGPFMAPYVNYTSFAVTLLAVNQEPIVNAIIVALLWAVRN